MSRPSTIALFYDGYEAQANDYPFGSLISHSRGALRQTYRRAKKLQPYTGFYTAYRNLRRSLEASGINVRMNDFSYARANPNMPIGITGFKSVFDKVQLSNPAMFGPGEVPAPQLTPAVVEACNLKVVTQPSEWYCKLWRPVVGEMMKPMFVGIDTETWSDLSESPKDIDVIVYDKIRWNYDARNEDVLKPLLAHLDAKGLSYLVLRYGHHHLGQFKAALSRARSLAFLCEHETQGIAYQEAMASGIPIFAWDEGKLVSPHDIEISETFLKTPNAQDVSSVPYFDERCGLKFKADTQQEAFDAFWEARESYAPRDYVCENLSLKAGAERYLELLGMIE